MNGGEEWIIGEPPRSFQLCPIHCTMYELGTRCCQCDAIASGAAQRDAQDILEARIADLEARLLSTNRQLATLQQIAHDLQRAHNATLPYMLTLAAQAGLLP